MAQKMPVGAVQERLESLLNPLTAAGSGISHTGSPARRMRPTYNTFDGFGWRNPVLGMSQSAF